jgi:very-short-patch-repair endonuclease/predicted transcriptional regulator of viral defense system
MPSNKLASRSFLNERMREVALSKDNVLTLTDLVALGLSPKMVQRRVSSGLLIPILKGSFALPGGRLRLRGRCRAALGSVSPHVVVSHDSALALHGLVPDPGIVHLMGEAGVYRGRGRKRWKSENFGFRVIRHETRSLPREHVVELNGIRVTTVERALRDYASFAKPSEISKALTQGERERSFCWVKLKSIVASSNGHKGIGILISEIQEWSESLADAASDPEIDFLLMVRSHGLPMPEVNPRLGPYKPDFLWRHLRLAVELDPYGTHSGFISHRRDHRKGIELEVRGLRVVRFSGEDIRKHEARTAVELRTIMERQAHLHRCPLFPEPGERPDAEK